MKAKKIHHQNNNSVIEDLVDWAVGVKDRRTQPRVEYGVYSPILHPLTHDAEMMPGMGMFPPNFHRYDWNFLSPHHTIIE